MRIKVPSEVVELLMILDKSGHEVYVVGGAVRDVLQKKSVADWDFTTDAKPEEIQELFKGSFYDNEFGTVRILKRSSRGSKGSRREKRDLEIFEVTTFRTEHDYGDRRRPDKVDWGKSLEEDLSRRDFTINAMALRAKLQTEKQTNTEFEIIDPFGGRDDLRNKIIRAVGKPDERFREDALRMMRAIRIASQLGFLVEKKTLEAIRGNHDLLKHVSWERIRDEMLKTLASSFPADGVMLMFQSNLLDYVLPELTAAVGVPQGGHHIYDVFTHAVEGLRHCPSSDTVVRLATLLHDIGKPETYRIRKGKITFYSHEVAGGRIVKKIADRLKLSRRQKDRLWKLVRWHMFAYEPKMTDASIRRFIRRVGIEDINDMMLLRVGDRKGGGSRATSWRLRELQQRIGELMYDPLQIKDLKVSGFDVMKVLKTKPGPKVGKVLNDLFEEVLEDPKKNERKYLLSRIKEIKI